MPELAPVAEYGDSVVQDPEPLKFKTQLPYLAQILGRITQNEYLELIESTGIAPAQAYVLGELWQECPLSQVELARRLDLGKATVGQTLARLERAGLITRERDPSDQRAFLIQLTPAGRAIRTPLETAARSQLAQLRQKLGDSLFDRMTAILAEVTESLCKGYSRPLD